MNIHEKLARDIHEENVQAGWWSDWPYKIERFDTAMALVVSELCEGLEGWRKDLMDDHLPHHKMLHVELADAAIRLYDCAGAYLDNLHTLEDAIKLAVVEGTIPEQLMTAVRRVSAVNMAEAIIGGLVNVHIIAQQLGIDIYLIMDEKRAYNRQRLDHKLENRNKKHGKKI